MWISGDDVVTMNMSHCDGGKALSILRLLIMKGSFKKLRNVLFKQVAFEIPLFKLDFLNLVSFQKSLAFYRK